jgi:hypothetical protein
MTVIFGRDISLAREKNARAPTTPLESRAGY